MAVVPLGEASPGAAISALWHSFQLSFVGLADVFDTCTGAHRSRNLRRKNPFHRSTVQGTQKEMAQLLHFHSQMIEASYISASSSCIPARAGVCTRFACQVDRQLIKFDGRGGQ